MTLSNEGGFSGYRPLRDWRPVPITIFSIIGMAAYPLVFMQQEVFLKDHPELATILPYFLLSSTLKCAGYLGMYLMRKWGPFFYLGGFLVHSAILVKLQTLQPLYLISVIVLINAFLYLPMMRKGVFSHPEDESPK